jgi:hypothetical protein
LASNVSTWHVHTTGTQIRTRALEVLFALLREFGPGFSASFWGLVYRGVLLPMFDDVSHAGRQPGSSQPQPQETTTAHAGAMRHDVM